MKNALPETTPFFARDRDMHPPAYTPWYKTTVLRSPQRALISLEGTKSEITGPVFGHNILNEFDNDLIVNYAKSGEGPIGQRILVHGRVIDERGLGVAGALVEFWPAGVIGTRRKPIWRPSIQTSAVSDARSPMRTASTGSRRSSPVPTLGRMA